MEARKVFEDVQGISNGQITDGVLRLTDYHLVFCAPIKQSEDSMETAPKIRERWIPFPIVQHMTFRPVPSVSRQAPSIRLRCRDFTFVTFNFTSNDFARDAFEFCKLRTCKLGTVDNLYAFKHKALKHEKDINGWEFYDPRAEFRRQGISEKLSDKGWRITTINQDYSFCDTYPAFLVVPSKISDNVLKYAREFRSRNRIPALSYLHPVNNCTITRSSQPYAGLKRNSNIQDEKLVAASFSAFISASGDSTPVPNQTDLAADGATSTLQRDISDIERFEDELLSKPTSVWDEKTGKRIVYGAQQNNLIADARPMINAMVNQMGGAGSENMAKYPFATKIFLSIENIHHMRNSLDKVISALKDADISPLPPSREALHGSEWLKHIHDVLDGSAIIARQVGIKHSHVLIHCSDGWDRTSQLSALAQIMLDPYFRTIEGFITLIEKDWLSFGHMFRLRSGHLSHEDWFSTQKDAYAGATVQPGENDGRDDAFQNILIGARRFLNKSKKDDPDGEGVSGEVVKDEATVPRMISPVFHQFLDCTHQLIRQHENRFEFNERFLRRILYHLHSCQYGTFLYNSEKQRKEARAAERTSSVWDYFLCRKAEFMNPNYDATVDDKIKGKERIMLPRLKEVRWWYQLFGRTDDEMNGELNAAAAAASDRQVAVSSLQYPSVAHTEDASSPPHPATTITTETAPSAQDRVSSGTNQSRVSECDSPYETLTPEPRLSTAPADTTLQSVKQSVTLEGSNAFAAIRDGIAGLGLGNMLSNTSNRPVEPQTTSTTGPRSDQELRDMT